MPRVGNEGGSGSPGNAAAAAAGLKSTIVTGTRTSAAGSGVQSVTGAGFAPLAAILYAYPTSGTVQEGSWGFMDDANVDHTMYITLTLGINGDTNCIVVYNQTTESMVAVGTFTSDGVDLTWTKGVTGLDTTFKILFLG